MEYLEAPRVRLLEFESDETYLLKDLDSDPEVMYNLTDGRPSTDAEAATGMERIQALKSKHQGRFGLWKAIEKESGEFMGWFLFRPCKQDPENVKSIELGYRLKKKFWGKGYATEVSGRLIEKGFLELDVDVIWAKTLLRNTKSWNIMKKLGMNLEKEFTEVDFEGSDKRAVKYSFTKEEWLLLR